MLLVSAGGLTLATLAFGFSMNITWAIVTRLFQGLFMGKYLTPDKKQFATALSNPTPINLSAKNIKENTKQKEF